MTLVQCELSKLLPTVTSIITIDLFVFSLNTQVLEDLCSTMRMREIWQSFKASLNVCSPVSSSFMILTPWKWEQIYLPLSLHNTAKATSVLQLGFLVLIQDRNQPILGLMIQKQSSLWTSQWDRETWASSQLDDASTNDCQRLFFKTKWNPKPTWFSHKCIVRAHQTLTISLMKK